MEKSFVGELNAISASYTYELFGVSAIETAVQNGYYKRKEAKNE